MLNLWAAKEVKRDRGRGVEQPKLKGMIREWLLDRTKTLEMKENNRVAIAIDQMIDVRARLAGH